MRYRGTKTRLNALAALAVLVLGGLAPLLAHAAEQYNRSVIGKWKLAAVLDASDIVAIDEKQAQELLGHVLIIGKDSVHLGSRVCDAPGFESSTEDTSRHLAEAAHASADKLGLPNPVTVVRISCTYVLIKKPDRLVVHWKGFFFDAVRVRQ